MFLKSFLLLVLLWWSFLFRVLWRRFIWRNNIPIHCLSIPIEIVSIYGSAIGSDYLGWLRGGLVWYRLWRHVVWSVYRRNICVLCMWRSIRILSWWWVRIRVLVSSWALGISKISLILIDISRFNLAWSRTYIIIICADIWV